MFTPSGQIDHLTFMGVRGGGGGKGGGGGQQPPPQGRTFVDPVDGTVFSESPYEQYFGGGINPDGTPRVATVDRYNQYVQDRKAREAAASQQATAQTTAEKAQAKTDFTGKKQTAYNDALNAVMRSFQLQGADPNQYMSTDIVPALQRQFNSIQDMDPNPAAAFSPTLGQDILNNVTSGRRTQLTGQLNSALPADYANTLLPDTTIDQYIGQILDEQFNPLSSQLQNARNRNTLNDSGYNAALAALGQKRTGAESTVRDLGRTILESDRSAVNDIFSSARTDLAGLGLSDPFDVNSYKSRGESRATSELGSFGGELRSKVGGTKFADLTELLNAGGAVQGANNPNATNPLGGPLGTSPFYVDPEEEARKGRGLGNTGAF